MYARTVALAVTAVGTLTAGLVSAPSGVATIVPVTAPAPYVPAPVTTPTPAPTATPKPDPRSLRSTPYFTTPQAAMRYLTWAFNGHRDRELRHVTTASARDVLVSMRGYAPALRLVACTRLPAGDYDCTFRHTLSKHPGKEGDAKFRVAPALAHGWYMTVLLECGDSAD